MTLSDATTLRARLRKVLFALLRTHDDLMTFLNIYFPDVQRRVNGSWTPDAIVNHLFTIEKEERILRSLIDMHPETVDGAAAAVGLSWPGLLPRATDVATNDVTKDVLGRSPATSGIPTASTHPQPGPLPPANPPAAASNRPAVAALDAHALLIGIANYHACRPLKKTLHDVEDIAAVLESPNLGGYAAGRVKLLRDQEATRRAILAALDGLAATASPDSTVLIHFAGHGGRIESGAYRGEYLFPVDTRRGTDLKEATDSAISSVEFSRKLAAIRARRLILLLDCCHAAGIGSLRKESFVDDQEPAGPELREGFSFATYTALASGEGSALLAACKDTETAAELHADRNGLFTKHLLAGLRGGAGGNSPFICIFDLFTYVRTRVTAENPAQHPIFECKRLTEDFPIALRRGGRNDDLVPPVAASPFQSRQAAPSYTRAYLYTTLCRLLPGMFDAVVFYLGVDVSQFASRYAPQATRASELMSYIELPGGGGHEAMLAALRSVLPNF